ncbi:glycoside hydrolase family 16 protein [Foetidibacter luteolus]|uniref:glycoside hydrolase family 16 protein n=1 Tax=Foetidibacter luteolus TaxID=2608880 RepID=UPI00129B885C|nr:glycoside hydrolase family 16 protein [Foetidibacter luteolus]
MRVLHIKTQGKLFRALSVVAALSVSLASCKKNAVQTLPQRSWELTWSDEFTGPAGALPDAAKWSFDIGASGWGNSELQYYTNRPSNAALDGDGNLVITARQESFEGAGFTSARINTKGNFSQSYGRFEARIKTPYGPGIWPAFWLLGDNIDVTPWPQCGEIDIMEQKGQEPYINHGSVHGPGYSGGGSITKAYALSNGRFDEDYHVYAIEWGEGYIDYFVDNFLFQRITPDAVTGEWVYDHPFYIILNVAVGGNYVGFPTSGTPFPQSMYVDYVKVYKQK